MTKVTFFGAAGEVTGSNHLIETAEHKYVVDCGLFQGGDAKTENNNEPFAYDAASVEAVIITHAHLDHIGRLPMLVKEGFRGPIYATEATIDLTAITLKDALGLMEHRAEQPNPLPPLYGQADLQRTMDLFKPVKYGQAQNLFGKDTVTFYDAGHILGSASVLVEADGKKLAFSGDIGYWPNALLPKPVPPPGADLVVTEATYGAVTREHRQDRLAVIRQAVQWAIDKRSVVLIPAFAIERSQELLYLLHHLFVEHQMPKMPIYLDSPLAIEALEVFEKHEDLFNKTVEAERPGGIKDVFAFRNLVLTPTVEDSKEINEQAPPKMIIAGSGMMDGGRIHHHLKRYLSHPDTLLLVVGYQAEHTLGREIVDGAKSVEIMNDWIPVRARIETVDIFSGHADDVELREWLSGIKIPDAGQVAIVHSEPDRAEAYKNEIAQQRPDLRVTVAKIGESLEV